MATDLAGFARQLHTWGANVTAIKPGTKRPLHKWQQWQEARQTEQELNTLPFRQAAAVGVVNGSGWFRCVDIDAPKDENGRPLYQVSESILITMLEAMGLPLDYQWSYASGSGAGWGFVVRCQEELSTDWAMDEKGVYIGLPKFGFQFDHVELRWRSGQTVIDGQHPTGVGYRWRLGERPFVAPAMVPANRVVAGFEAVATWKTAVANENSPVVFANGNNPYATGALNNAIQQVSTAPSGNRNNTLFQQTASLTELANGGELTHDTVQQGMQRAGLAAGLPEDEVLATITSAVNHVGEKARNAPKEETAVSSEPLPNFLPLPAHAYLDPVLGAAACPWLDEYIAFSREMSPRGYAGFHEAVGLWLLSTITARRLVVRLGTKSFYPNLYIALCAFTTLYAKTTTARIGIDVLTQAGLSHLLLPNDLTPQAFINHLGCNLRSDYGDLSPDEQRLERQRLQFAGQKGWFYEEFGRMVSAMMRETGYMADFRGLLRSFDDNPPVYEYKTMTRHDKVMQPYLALLVNMTPADIRPYAKSGSPLWGDGFWARWAFITPPPHHPPQYGRFPDSQVNIPAQLLNPLRQWHESLGIPTVNVTPIHDEEGKPTGKYQAYRESIEPTSCQLGEGVLNAFYAYHDSLVQLAGEQVDGGNTDLMGNYGRLAEKALRIAMLLAGVSNGNRLELCHWARGQTIAERWRTNLHHLAEQVAAPAPSQERELQDKVAAVLQRHGVMTAAEIARHIRNVSSPEVEQLCRRLIGSGALVEAEKTTRNTTRYRLP